MGNGSRNLKMNCDKKNFIIKSILTVQQLLYMIKYSKKNQLKNTLDNYLHVANCVHIGVEARVFFNK